MQVIINSLLTNYIVEGTGKKVILMLHGWGDNLGTFDQLCSVLKTDYKLIRLDLPGFGGTEAPQDSWGLDNYCNFIAQWMQKTQIKKIDCLIGHSNGGAIAIRGLGSSKLTADKLVLLASSGIRDTYSSRNKGLRLAAKMAKIATKPLPKYMQNKIKKKVYKTIGSDLFVAEHMQGTFKKIITDDVQKDAKKIKTPTLIIYGSNDTATPALFGRTFNNLIQNSLLHIIDGGDHFVHHGNSQKIVRLIKEFVK